MYLWKSITLVCLLSWMVPHQSPTQSPQPTMEDRLASPCFKLSTQEVFEKAEKEVVQTVQLVLNGNGSLYLQGGSRANYLETDGPKRRIAGVVLGGFARNSDTRAGVLLRCKLTYEDGHSVTKYYAPAQPLFKVEDAAKKGIGSKDAAFLWFTPELTKDYNNIEVTALSLTEGKRTKYVGKI